MVSCLQTNWIDEVVEEFGDAMGMPGLALSESGCVHLSVEHAGELYVERGEREDAALVYLTRPLLDGAQGNRLSCYREALISCQEDEQHPFAVHVAITGEDHLVFLMQVTQEDFTLPALERMFKLLTGLHDRVGTPCR